MNAAHDQKINFSILVFLIVGYSSKPSCTKPIDHPAIYCHAWRATEKIRHLRLLLNPAGRTPRSNPSPAPPASAVHRPHPPTSPETGPRLRAHHRQLPPPPPRMVEPTAKAEESIVPSRAHHTHLSNHLNRAFAAARFVMHFPNNQNTPLHSEMSEFRINLTDGIQPINL